MAAINVICKSCEENIIVTGDVEELQAGVALLETVECESAGTFYIQMFRCPYCGELHTPTIDTQETRMIRERSLRLMGQAFALKSEMTTNPDLDKRKAKKNLIRLNHKTDKNNDRLRLKRAELGVAANGKVFHRKDNGQSFVYETYIYKDTEEK